MERRSMFRLMKNILFRLSPLTRVRLGNTRPRRDFLFVKDTVKGFIALGRCDEAIGKAVNIGTGEDVSIGELVRKIFALTGKEREIEVEDQRVRPEKSEVMQLLCDTRLAQALFGWKPGYTLEEGLRETLEWYRENLARFRVGSYPL